MTAWRKLCSNLLLTQIGCPDTIEGETHEIIGECFCLWDPTDNRNNFSNYEYADEFFKWLLTGDTDLTEKIKKLNPYASKFTDSTNLPESFSSTYGWKIKEQLPLVLKELSEGRSRRAYINILLPEDKIILSKNTTHEYPCTIGIQFLRRGSKLHCIVNMRSNNIFSVLPYDVYNFTMLQIYVAKLVKLDMGRYYHTINSAHIYKRDLDKINESINRV